MYVYIHVHIYAETWVLHDIKKIRTFGEKEHSWNECIFFFFFFFFFFAGIGIVFNVAGCLIRGRRRWSVTYTSPHMS